jgi:hypothetical protein
MSINIFYRDRFFFSSTAKLAPIRPAKTIGFSRSA